MTDLTPSHTATVCAQLPVVHARAHRHRHSTAYARARHSTTDCLARTPSSGPRRTASATSVVRAVTLVNGGELELQILWLRQQGSQGVEMFSRGCRIPHHAAGIALSSHRINRQTAAADQPRGCRSRAADLTRRGARLGAAGHQRYRPRGPAADLSHCRARRGAVMGYATSSTRDARRAAATGRPRCRSLSQAAELNHRRPHRGAVMGPATESTRNTRRAAATTV